MNKLNWKYFLAQEKNKDYFIKIKKKILKDISLGKIIYPPLKNIFYALSLTDIKNIKVVILGQDPYHQPNQANGLAFSVPLGVIIPPSLKNIYKEIYNDINNFKKPKHGYLKKWAQQGILLLNTTLTVEKDKPNSHANFGWVIFTDTIIKIISNHCEKVVFLLWGNKAKKKKELIDNKKHKILCSSHPSPLSAHVSFFGCRHFSKTNNILLGWNKTPINWNV